MSKAIGLTPAMFGFGAGIFFIGYVVPPGAGEPVDAARGRAVLDCRGVTAWARCRPRLRLSWAAQLLRHAVSSRVAESGFFPGTLLYLSLWFPARQRAVALRAFMAARRFRRHLGRQSPEH